MPVMAYLCEVFLKSEGTTGTKCSPFLQLNNQVIYSSW